MRSEVPYSKRTQVQPLEPVTPVEAARLGPSQVTDCQTLLVELEHDCQWILPCMAGQGQSYALLHKLPFPSWLSFPSDS